MKMNRLLTVAALGTLVFASCSNEEIISSQQLPRQAIDFKAMANKSSRADVTTSNIDRFRVFGCNMDASTTDNHVMSFNNVTVEKKDGAWRYNDIQYWAPNKDYYFVALSTNNVQPAWTFSAPTTHETVLSPTSFKGYGTVTMDIESENTDNPIDADRDLVYAYATRTTDANVTDASAIDFTFNHMLSRVAFSFKNTFTNSAYSFKISSITLTGLIKKATCDLGVDPGALVWTPAGTDMATVSVIVPDNASATTTTPITSTANCKYIIPGTQTLKLSFTVTVMLGASVYSVRTLSGTIQSTDYKPGTSYLLTAEISQANIISGGAKPIDFTVTKVEAWGTDTGGTVEIN